MWSDFRPEWLRLARVLERRRMTLWEQAAGSGLLEPFVPASWTYGNSWLNLCRGHRSRFQISMRIGLPAWLTQSSRRGMLISFSCLGQHRKFHELYRGQKRMNPAHIYHADWGSAPNKRWLAQAELGSVGRYTAHSPNRIEKHTDLIPRIRRQIDSGQCALVGFDFPIGIPAPYARLAGVTDFKSFLRQVGSGEWADFHRVARVPSEISIQRPFYPFAPGKTRQAHLLSALGLESIDDLRRECDKGRDGRRAACPLFWTLGANQVGKGAIVGWRDVLAPALRDDKSVFIWPFDGRLDELLQPGTIVIAETYPAECYGWFFAEPLKGKGNLDIRKKAGGHLLRWAETACVALDPALAHTIRKGFPEGDDAFDSVVGLFGMIEVVTGRRQPGEDTIRKLEGWILGQASE